MKRRISGVVLGSMLSAALWLTAYAEDKPQDAKLAMRDKLSAAQDVLEGLVTPDFPLLRSGAVRMQAIVKHRSWNVYTTEQYAQYSEELRRQSQALIDAADKRDLDRSALAYVQVTFTCINCHKHVRDIKVADGRRPGTLEIDDQLAQLMRQHTTVPR